MFDPNTFLNQSVTGPLSTKIPVIPLGDYRAQIDKLEPRKVTTKAGDSPQLRIVWKLIDATELASIDRAAATVRQDLWLDLKDGWQNSAWEMEEGEGKNVGLGRLFEALGMNNGGINIGQLKGQVGIIKIGHRGDDKGNVYDEVQRVASLT
jgi:hypothetical protein